MKMLPKYIPLDQVCKRWQCDLRTIRPLIEFDGLPIWALIRTYKNNDLIYIKKTPKIILESQYEKRIAGDGSEYFFIPDLSVHCDSDGYERLNKEDALLIIDNKEYKKPQWYPYNLDKDYDKYIFYAGGYLKISIDDLYIHKEEIERFEKKDRGLNINKDMKLSEKRLNFIDKILCEIAVKARRQNIEFSPESMPGNINNFLDFLKKKNLTLFKNIFKINFAKHYVSKARCKFRRAAKDDITFYEKLYPELYNK